MALFFQIHPHDPQPRLIRRAVELIRDGALLVYPSDSGYTLGCRANALEAQAQLRRIRQLDERHLLALCCADLAQAAQFCQIPNPAFRLVRPLVPGPFTFILRASKEAPRRLQDNKRKTVGVRIPAHVIAQALIAELGEPLISASLILPGEEESLPDPFDIRERLDHQVEAVLDGGYLPHLPSTILDLSGDEPVLIRQGTGRVPGLSPPDGG
jgi:tRNA threonylcarbamoyl adenosine modification protein (Sua5/YciO/YrdC/YwlC family)